MNFKDLKDKIKEEQKQLALQIRNGKSGRKPRNRCDDNINDFDTLGWNQHDYRHRHIIYCNMFNNTPYDAIEQPSDTHCPSSYQMDKIRNKWEAELDEDVCNSA